MTDEQWQAAVDYIELLESCQDGYYRASESDEAKRWHALRAAPTPPAVPPGDLVANALRSLNALEGLARAYAYETNAFDNSGTFAECVRAALVAPGAPSALNHWRDMFESKLAEAIRQGDPMVKFSLTPNQMRDIAAALAAPVGETPAETDDAAWSKFLVEWVDYNLGKGHTDKAWDEFQESQRAGETPAPEGT